MRSTYVRVRSLRTPLIQVWQVVKIRDVVRITRWCASAGSSRSASGAWHASSHSAHHRRAKLRHELLHHWSHLGIGHHLLQLCWVGHQTHWASRCLHDLLESRDDLRVFHRFFHLRVVHHHLHHATHSTHSGHAAHVWHASTGGRSIRFLLLFLFRHLFVCLLDLFGTLSQLLLLFDPLLRLLLFLLDVLFRQELQIFDDVRVKVDGLGLTQVRQGALPVLKSLPSLSTRLERLGGVGVDLQCLIAISFRSFVSLQLDQCQGAVAIEHGGRWCA
mmetsp:Transcript_5288/g.14305  ORF Transcript_5288/g.14305 Transcript_5288/m.14305 type:complete len:274 (+) Transcript_5288:988-1809(+)